MITLKRILIATDFSEHARVALRYAAALAGAFESEIVLCHVLESAQLLAQLPPTGEAYFPPDLLQQEEAHSRAECERLAAESGARKIRYTVRQGSPFVEIVAAAREEQADLLVVGTHGRGAIAHMLLGSVAERIVRKAPCPVLTVRQGEHDFVMP
jgi:nucleotide-binding universal stress UspA family protein